MTFWLSAFWYCNPVFTRHAWSMALPYGILHSVPAEISLSLLKSISRWHKFILVKTIIVCRIKFYQKWSILEKQLLLSLIFRYPIFHYLSLFYNLFNCSQLFMFKALNSFPLFYISNVFRFRLLRVALFLDVPKSRCQKDDAILT